MDQSMSRIAFTIIQLVLLAGIILLGISIVYRPSAIDDTALALKPTAAAPHAGTKPSSQPKPFAYYEAISQRDLFQTPKEAASAPAAIALEDLKPTELKLKLWGTITGEDGMRRAVIADQSKRQQSLFRVGDEVANAKIKMILREKVILSVNGENQILEIEKPAKAGAPSTPSMARSMARAIVQQDEPPEEPDTLDEAPPEPDAIPAPAAPMIRLRLSQLGPISDNPEDWSDYAAVVPYKGSDGANGLLFNRITPSSPLRRLGIRNGDVLLSLNGQPVGTIGDIVGSLKEASAGQEFSLNIKRSGRERQLDFLFE